MTEATRFYTDERSPPLRVRTRTWADSPNLFVTVEEHRDGGWCRVGSIELGFGPTDRRREEHDWLQQRVIDLEAPAVAGGHR